MSSAPVSNTAPKTVTAAMLIIGDEILSGRTKDANLGHFAEELNAMGIQMREARVVSDVEDEIVDALNALRARFTYVFTTGGIGPTHDDITADAVAKAFGVSIDYDPRAVAILEAHYPKGALNEARMRMTRIPDGADLIENPVSNAPGFHIENVFCDGGRASHCPSHAGKRALKIGGRQTGSKPGGACEACRRSNRGRSGHDTERLCGCVHRFVPVLFQGQFRGELSAALDRGRPTGRRRRGRDRACEIVGGGPHRPRSAYAKCI